MYVRMGIENRGAKMPIQIAFLLHTPNPNAQSNKSANTVVRCTPRAYNPQQKEALRQYLEAITPERLNPSLHFFLESIYQLGCPSQYDMPSCRLCLSIGAAFATTGALFPTDAFLNGPSMPCESKVLRPRILGGKTQLDDLDALPTVEETIELSPLNCEVIKVEEPRPDILVEPLETLTTAQARAIALEAATTKTVPKSTVLEALRSLARNSVHDLLNVESPVPAGAIDGIWRLCFCDGDFLQGIEVDNHGYLERKQQVDVLFDCDKETLVLGSSGLSSSLPKIVHSRLAYIPETQTVIGMFDKEAMGIGSLKMQVFLVDADALGFYTMSQGNEGFLLFRAERSKRAVERLSKFPVSLPKEASGAQRAATAAAAGEDKVETNANLKLVDDENAHENRRLAVEETGRQTGSFNTFMRYLETEGPTIYMVLAGPVLIKFVRQYSPIATAKLAAALIVLGETFRHFVSSSA